MFQLSATNNEVMAVSKYFEADVTLLGFRIPWLGFLVVKDPTVLLEPQNNTQEVFLLSVQLLFLGHLLLKDGILPNPEQVSKVKDWPIPKSAKEVHSFLGLASYYRKFIPQFAKWASPLHNLI